MNITYNSPIFGPVHSRRLGISLGINLLPGDGKWCSFDCLYCECGLNANKRTKTPLPKRDEVRKALEKKLQQMVADGELPDVLTFAGNGEPTMNPEFPQIIDDVIALRDKYCPKAKVSVLSNSTMIHKEEVRKALMKTDNPIMKLDGVDSDYIYNVDRPTGHYDVNQIIENLAKMSPNVIIQTMVLKTSPDQSHSSSPLNPPVIGGRLPLVAQGGENISPSEVLKITPSWDGMGEAYISALKKINPRQIMIYTIDREPPVSCLQKATHEEMDSMAEKLRKEGFNVSISY